jgi:peptidoglycan biosynthesis protein MviN/MurJ (putative lipid II flippase)
LLDAAFYRFGTWGIPLSTTFVNIAGTFALLELLRRRLGRVELAETGRAFAKIVLASAVVAVVSYFAWRGLDTELGRSLWAQIVSLGVAILGSVLAYALACRMLGVRELRALLSLRRRTA